MNDPFQDEAAKAAGKILVDTVKDARNVLTKLFGPAIEEIGEGLRDKVKLWRLNNISQIMSRMNEIRERQGYKQEDIKALTFGDAVRTIETASFEEDPDIQEMWAKLLSNATIPGSGVVIKKVYADVLRSLSAPDAVLLDFLWTCERRTARFNPTEIKEIVAELNAAAELRWRQYGGGLRHGAIQNLVRLRCITFRPRSLQMNNLLGYLPDREGRIRGRWAGVDPEKFQRLLEHLSDLIFAASGAKEYHGSGEVPIATLGGMIIDKIQIPEMSYMLTELGRDLMAACSIASLVKTSETVV